jgi:hypothetical protein
MDYSSLLATEIEFKLFYECVFGTTILHTKSAILN